MQNILSLIDLLHIIITVMKTFRDKYFKNKLDPKATYYDCIRSCELNTSTEQGVENCVLKCTRPLAVSEGYRYLKAGLV